MVTFIIRRLLASSLMLVVVSMVTFAIFFLVPRIVGATPETIATRYVGRTATEATVRDVADRLGFYDPFFVQYWNFLKGVVTGADYSTGVGTEFCAPPCFGYSFLTQRAVWPEIVERFPVTFSLAIGAALIWLVAGVAIGVLSALRKGSFFDRAAMTFALAGVSMPIFWTGLMSLVVFSYGLHLTAPGGSYVPVNVSPGQWAYSLLLPWITLALLFAAGYARLTRAGMLETMGEDYVRTARAKGLTERVVVAKHGLRGALTPIVTMFGLDFGLLLGGAVLTETAFSLPGLGQFAIQAITNNDLPKVMGFTMVAAFFVVMANLIVDVLYAVVDPRVRLS